MSSHTNATSVPAHVERSRLGPVMKRRVLGQEREFDAPVRGGVGR
jgi:hypothetical protein